MAEKEPTASRSLSPSSQRSTLIQGSGQRYGDGKTSVTTKSRNPVTKNTFSVLVPMSILRLPSNR